MHLTSGQSAVLRVIYAFARRPSIHDGRGEAAAADLDRAGGAGGGRGGGEVGHRDWSPERRAEAAAGDQPGDFAVDDDRGALAHRLAAVDREADAPAARAFGELCEDDRGPGKAAVGAPPLRHREGQPGLDRGRVGGQVVAVERQPGLEPQRVARAQPDRPHLGLGEEGFGEGFGAGGGKRHLEAVLASVARAADPQVDAVPAEAGGAHEAQVGDAGDEAVERGDRQRPLQREQREVVAPRHVEPGGAKMSEVGRLGRAVDDEVEVAPLPT